MKNHILRSPHTDRYVLRVPMRLSDLEDDISGSAQLQAMVSLVYPDNPTPDGPNFSPIAGTNPVVTLSTGFTVNQSGNVGFQPDAAGFYALTLTMKWRSLLDSPSFVGRATTAYANTSISGALNVNAGTVPGLAAALMSQTILLDNKLGYATDASDTADMTVSSSGVLSLAAGDLIQPVSFCAGDPSGARAHGGIGVGFFGELTLTMVRIA